MVLVGHRPIKSPYGIGSLIGPNVFYFYDDPFEKDPQLSGNS